MAFVLTLQFLMLLFAATGFAAPSPACPPPSLIKDSPGFENFELINVFLGVAQLSYTCTDSGKYEIVDIESVLVDATCINGGGYLEEILVDAVGIISENSDAGTSEWGASVEEKFNLKPAGTLNSLNSSSFEIDFGVFAGKNGDTSVVVSITDNYSGGQGQHMVNEDESFLIGLELLVVETDGQSSSTCAAGSSGSVGAALFVYVYESD